MRPERRERVLAATTSQSPPTGTAGTAPAQVSSLGLPLWIYETCTALILLLLAVQSLRLLTSRGRAFERDFTLALRSGFVFLLLMVPLTYPEQIASVSSNIQAVYIWLPLWYMSTLKKSLGGWIQICVHALAGTVSALLVILALNKVLPLREAAAGLEWKWLALIFVLTYAVGLIPVGQDMKKFFFGTLSPLLVFCLQAEPPGGLAFFESKETALIFEEHVNWTSLVFCYLYLTFTALLLSGFTLMLRFWRCLASNDLAQELAEMALETWRSLKLLLKYFSCRPSDFDLDALGQHLQLLKIGTLHLENRLLEAQWETFCWRQHRRLHSLLQLLMSIHLVLLAALSWLSGHPAEAPVTDLAPFLQEFESACGSILRSLTGPWWLRQSQEDQDAAVIDALEHTELADGALMASLEQLREFAGRPESTTPAVSVMHPSAAFVETLREIPKIIKDFLLNKVADLDFQPSIEAQWVMEQPWSRSYKRQALGYAVAYVCSLIWCIRFRQTSALCSIMVAWLPFTWVTLRCTLNEFLGTAGGVLLGTLPTFILRFSPVLHDGGKGRGRPWAFGPHELFLCFSLMYILWTTATYYAQVQTFQWRVAALFWSCFGGIEMLRDFGLAEDLRSNVWKQQSWNSIVDFSIGCGLVFFCQVFLGAVCQEATAKSQAASATACSLQSCAQLVSAMQDRDGYLMRGQASELLTRVAHQQQRMQEVRQSLAKEIMAARFWNAESLHCLRVWDVPWRSILVNRILDQCDSILLASRTIAWSSERFGGPGPSALMLKATVPAALSQRLHHCSDLSVAALNGSKEWRTNDTEAASCSPAAASPAAGSGDAQSLAAAAAQSAMRGAVHVMCNATAGIEAALAAQETLSLSSWTKPSSKSMQVPERESLASDMA